MNINISNYIESALNPEGRFSTIKEIYTLKDGNSDSVMSSSSSSVDFEIMWAGKKYIMKCLRNVSEASRQMMKEASSYAGLADTHYLAKYVYLEKEMLVFDNFDNARYVDIVLQQIPEGKRLDKFLEQDIATGAVRMNQFIKGLSGLCRWMIDNSVSHGKINPYRVWITNSSTPVLADLSYMERGIPLEDTRSLAIIASVGYISVCEPGFYSYMGSEMLSGKSDILHTMSELIDDEAPLPLKELWTLITKKTSSNSEETILACSICYAIEKLSECEPAPIKNVTKIVNKLGFNHDSPTHLPATQAQVTKYRFVGELNDCMIRVWDGERWYYLDKNRVQAIKTPFINASDFREGRAEVETETGYGLIDRDGNYVIEPVFDDIEWDAVGNLAVVTKDGLSGLYSREGKSITGLIYDQILNISEDLVTVKKDKRYGYISREGQAVIDLIYEDAFGFRNGAARVKLKGREYMIDVQGNEIGEVSEPKPVAQLK